MIQKSIFILLLLVGVIITNITAQEQQNDAEIQFRLGLKYLNGLGKEQNLKKIDVLLEKIANKDEQQSSILDEKLSNKVSLKKLRSWFDEVSNKKHARLQYAIGLMYAQGEKQYRDLEQAKKWFEKAANQGYKKAQYALGLLYYKAKDFEKACLWWEKVAEQGDVNVQYKLGLMYYEGKEVTKDLSQAKKWFEKATNQGDKRAKYALGLMYYKGDGVEKNLEKAHDYLQELLPQKSIEEKYALGLMYYKGDGVIKNLNKAFYWFEQVARESRKYSEQRDYYGSYRYVPDINNQTILKAQYALGLMYYKGDGITKDLGKAYSWFKQATEDEDRNNYRNNYSYDSQKKESLKEAEYALGLMYYKGEGVTINWYQAKKWFQKAANQNLSEANFTLAMLEYYNEQYENHDIPQMSEPLSSDNVSSFNSFVNRPLEKITLSCNTTEINNIHSVYLQLVKANNAKEAQFMLGMMYYNGINILVEYKKEQDKNNNKNNNYRYNNNNNKYIELEDEPEESKRNIYYTNRRNYLVQGWTKEVTARSIKQAKILFEKASEQGDVKAQCALGLMYYDDKNFEKAKILFEKASEQGDVKAQCVLGLMYYEGLGVDKDLNQAKKWFEKATNQGDKEAKDALYLTYYNGANVNGAEKTQDLEQAKKWFEELANQGDVKAQYILGLMYYNNDNFEQAKILFEQASNQGDIKSQCILGLMYYNGLGVDKDFEKAKVLFEKNTNQNLAQFIFDNMQDAEEKEDLEKARFWLGKASNQGNPKAKRMLNSLQIQIQDSVQSPNQIQDSSQNQSQSIKEIENK